jgi:putative transposase
MTGYRRSLLKGGSYFFTVVTYDRLPILTSNEARAILHSAWIDVRKRFPLTTVAVCPLPDHLHCIWSLPENDADYSVRWKEIKGLSTREYLLTFGPGEIRSESRMKKGEAAIWQRRFWEHTIRDEDDLNRHIDYIHYNPVKHGVVQRVVEWPWSSFHRYVQEGHYGFDWGVGEEIQEMVFGE